VGETTPAPCASSRQACRVLLKRIPPRPLQQTSPHPGRKPSNFNHKNLQVLGNVSTQTATHSGRGPRYGGAKQRMYASLRYTQKSGKRVSGLPLRSLTCRAFCWRRTMCLSTRPLEAVRSTTLTESFSFPAACALNVLVVSSVGRA